MSEVVEGRPTSSPASRPARNPDPATYAFSYSEALRSITQQQAVLSDLRGRAGILLSATAVATSFLGGIAFNDKAVGIFGQLAVAAFVIIGALCVGLLLPLRGWQFRFNPRDLINLWIEDSNGHPNMAEIHRGLALYLQDDYAGNDRKMWWLWWGYRVAAAMLVVEVALWLAELGRLA